MIRMSMIGTVAFAFLAGLASLTFAASGDVPGQSSSSPDPGMSSGSGGSPGSPSDAPSKKTKKSSESSLGIEPPSQGQGTQGQGTQGQGMQQEQGAQGLGGQTDSPLKGQEKAPEGKSK
jgi:hypothetical protein